MGKLNGGKCSGPFIRFIDDFKIRNINLEFFGNRFNFGFVTNQDGIGDAAVLGGSYCFKNGAVLCDSNGNCLLSAFFYFGNQSIETCTHLSIPHLIELNLCDI